MTLQHAHIVGAGLAGLAAALSLSKAGVRVTIYEAGPAAGGRCRSYDDRVLGCRIDNGNHLVLSGNQAVHAYLAELGTQDTLAGPGRPDFPFVDLGSGERWIVRLNAGRVPWWVLVPGRRVPGTRLRDYARLQRLRRPPAGSTLAALLDHGALARRLLEPLAIAALNTPLAEASADLFAHIMAETLGAGGRACIPAFPAHGLSTSFVDPAVALIEQRGGQVHTGYRIAAVTTDGNRITALQGSSAETPIGPGEAVILAVPAPNARELLPTVNGPDAFCAIVNLHYRIDLDPGRAGFIGLVGGLAEWVFVKPGVVSVTISAANRLVDTPAEQLAATIWPEVRRACALDATVSMPPWRVVKEKRATFAATPAQERLRPASRTRLANVALAGDWTATGLPATIEGAIRSGREAARVLLA